MTKQAFLSSLRARLSGLPEQDIDERLGFYSEMIDDRIEDGVAEEDAVAEIGGVDEIAAQILADYPLSKIVREKVKKRRLGVWEIVLLVLGFPVWFSLLAAAFAAALSLYVVLWALVIVLWAVWFALTLSSLCALAAAAVLFIKGNAPAGAVMLGGGLFCAGFSIFLFFGCRTASKGAALLTKKIFLGIKTRLIGKERSK